MMTQKLWIFNSRPFKYEIFEFKLNLKLIKDHVSLEGVFSIGWRGTSLATGLTYLFPFMVTSAVRTLPSLLGLIWVTNPVGVEGPQLKPLFLPPFYSCLSAICDKFAG